MHKIINAHKRIKNEKVRLRFVIDMASVKPELAGLPGVGHFPQREAPAAVAVAVAVAELLASFLSAAHS